MPQTQEIRVPDLGDVDDVTVSEVLVAAGDAVEVDQSLISLESDKASMDVPSPAAGTVSEIKVSAGDAVAEGTVILILETGGTEAEKAPEPEAEKAPPEPEAEKTPEPDAEPEKPEPKHEPAIEPAPATTAPTGAIDQKIDETGFAKAYASPSVRRLARELGVNLGKVEGTGRKGRILKEDVQSYVKAALQRGVAPAAAGVSGFAWPAAPDVDFSKFGEVERKPLSRIRKVGARNLHRSWLHVPHVTQHEDADVTDMEAFRQAHSEEAKSRGFKLTPVAFLLKACAATLRAHPTFNASLDPDGEHLILKRYVHIGVAVDTPDGLVVPVLRDVDKKGLYQLAEELVATSIRARDGKLTPADYQGGCFTISSLGGIGGTAFTPIVNTPEVAILGVSRSRWTPVWQDGEFVPRLMLPLSLSYDHRVIDGAAAARFVVHLSGLLGDLRRLLL